MPETYTQEQIHDIATALYGWTALPRILPSAPGTGPDWDIGADIRAILSALSTAERERDALKAQVAELEAKLQGAGWISIKDNKPEYPGEYLMYDDDIGNQSICTVKWTGKLWTTTNPAAFAVVVVTHWMPLPEPPAIVGKKEG